MSDIGVPELKTHVSEIVCKVKEGGKRYIIPLHGRPAAAIVPVEDAQAGRDFSSEQLFLGRTGSNRVSDQPGVEIFPIQR